MKPSMEYSEMICSTCLVPIVAALMTAHLVSEAGICADKGGFDLVSYVFAFNLVSMYDVNRG